MSFIHIVPHISITASRFPLDSPVVNHALHSGIVLHCSLTSIFPTDSFRIINSFLKSLIEFITY